MRGKSSDPETESSDHDNPLADLVHDLSVVGYVNSKQAALFKRMIWEAMNKDYGKGYAPAFEEGTKSNCGSLGHMQISNEKNSRDDEFEHESNGYSEEAEARQGQDDDSYVANDKYNGFANDKYNGYNYDDEYNYDEECDFDEL